MLQNIYFQYKNACMMLFRREGDELTFRGSAFLAHPDGYLLTAGHLITGKYEFMVVPVEETAGFVTVHSEIVTPIRVEVRQIDPDRDLALLKFTENIDISMPDHVLDVSEDVPIGNSVACMGFSFGYYSIYSQLIKQAVICSKIRSGNGTRLFLFDTRVHDGNRGGPLINIYDGRVIGVVGGRFTPQELMPPHLKHAEAPIKTNISYAISVQHAADLMKQEDLSVV